MLLHGMSLYPDSEASYSAGSSLTSLSIFFISLSLELHLLYDYTTSKIVAIQVMIFTQFTRDSQKVRGHL